MLITGNEDIVTVRKGKGAGDPTELTVSCPDKVGLGSDLVRVVFEFGLAVVRGDFSTDGKWCFVVLWVQPIKGGLTVRWPLLKQRLSNVAPPVDARLIPSSPRCLEQEMFLLQVCSSDRSGLLNDVAQLLWEVELTIHRVHVTTSPDGKAVDLFFVTDNKEELPDKLRASDLCDKLTEALGPDTHCELSGAEGGGGLGCAPQESMSPVLAESLFVEREVGGELVGPGEKVVSPATVTVDNGMSPVHSILQVSTRDRKGLLYDVMRTLKDVHVKVAYGKLATEGGLCEMDMFVQGADGRKVTDPQAQRDLSQRLRREVERPMRIVMVSRGPDTELLVATPLEISGKGRPRVLHDVTLAIRLMKAQVFKADITRHLVKAKQWEVYRFMLNDKYGLPISNPAFGNQLCEKVRSVLMGNIE